MLCVQWSKFVMPLPSSPLCPSWLPLLPLFCFCNKPYIPCNYYKKKMHMPFLCPFLFLCAIMESFLFSFYERQLSENKYLFINKCSLPVTYCHVFLCSFQQLPPNTITVIVFISKPMKFNIKFINVWENSSQK